MARFSPLLLALAPAPAQINVVEPAPPEVAEVAIAAVCRGRSVSLRYALRSPGRDTFSEISVDGEKLPAAELGALNELIGPKPLYGVDIVACEGTADGYDVHVRLTLQGERGDAIRRFGIRHGRIRSLG